MYCNSIIYNFINKLSLATFASVVMMSASVSAQTVVELRAINRLPFQLRESSGIAISSANRIWSHNDSGNTNQLFCFDTLGTLIRTVTIENIENIDWEDLARDPEGNIYINDAGNNDNNRTNLAIHIVPNPDATNESSIQATSIQFSFPDQMAFPPPSSNRNFDIEAIIWHNDSLVLFTKNRSNPMNGYCKMYTLPTTSGQHIARLKDSVFIGSTTNAGRVTAAAFNHQTNTLLLLTRAAVIGFDQFQGNEFFKGRKTYFSFQSLPGQAEAIDFVTENQVYITEEGSSSQGGFLYALTLPLQVGIGKRSLDQETPDIRLSENTVKVQWSNEAIIPAVLELIDMHGNVVSASFLTNKIQASNLQKGMYILRIQLNDRVISKKLMF